MHGFVSLVRLVNLAVCSYGLYHMLLIGYGGWWQREGLYDRLLPWVLLMLPCIVIGQGVERWR